MPSFKVRDEKTSRFAAEAEHLILPKYRPPTLSIITSWVYDLGQHRLLDDMLVVGMGKFDRPHYIVQASGKPLDDLWS